MKLKANDTLHISSVGPENIEPGGTFEVGDEVGKELVRRKLATEVAGGSKAEPKHANKAEPAPENKGVISAKSVPTKSAGAKS